MAEIKTIPTELGKNMKAYLEWIEYINKIFNAIKYNNHGRSKQCITLREV